MIVAVDESGDDCHLLGVKLLRPLADERPDVCVVPHGDKPVGFDRERLRLRYTRIGRVDFCVEYNEIGVLSSEVGALRFGGPCRT